MTRRACVAMFTRFGLIDAVMEIELLTRDQWGFRRAFDDVMLSQSGRMPYTKPMRERWDVELKFTDPERETGLTAHRIWRDGTVITSPEKNKIDSHGMLVDNALARTNWNE